MSEQAAARHRAQPVPKGTLGRQALDYLTGHPDGAFTASEVRKGINARSVGAITNALERLAAAGQIDRLTTSRPVLYRAAPSSQDGETP